MMLEEMVARIAEQSNGLLEIKFFPYGAVVDYTETLDAIQSGILDAQQTGTVYFCGRDPGFAITELPGAYPDGAMLHMFLEHGGGPDFMRKLYAQYGLHAIGFFLLGPESLVSRTPLHGTDDLKGFHPRAPQGMVSEFFSRPGTSPVSMSGPEIRTAIERGGLDGTDRGGLAVDARAEFHQIAPYPIHPGFHTNATGDISVNRKWWD